MNNTIRENNIKKEQGLSEYATQAINSKGRITPIEPCLIRTCFVRDRDRIIHSKSFRRLKHKTQVFLSPEGDHYRTRLTHTLEVTQIARTLARALALNEDLTEAISLGHDLGHTPFGHAGERTLNCLSVGYIGEVPRNLFPNGFLHNKQSLRVVDILENNGKGLNLTSEVRDGILNHKLSTNPITLEGKIVSYADRIAYINHDIEDAIRADIITISDLPKQTIEILGVTKSNRINTLILDIIENSMGKNQIVMSDKIKIEFDRLYNYMQDNIYNNESPAKGEEIKADRLLRLLYKWFMKSPEKLPELYIKLLDEYDKSTVVCDYIASMTDRYATKLFEDIYIPLRWDKM